MISHWSISEMMRRSVELAGAGTSTHNAMHSFHSTRGVILQKVSLSLFSVSPYFSLSLYGLLNRLHLSITLLG